MSQLINSLSQKTIPISVNYFPHRKCNYSCKFCFHTDTSSKTVSLPEAKRGLQLLAEAGMRKLNISGGEPFLDPEFLGQIIKYAKEDLSLESTGVICNGSKVTLKWLNAYGDYLDIMGVSCDSFDEETNERIGRKDPSAKGAHHRKVFQVADWCKDRKIMFKMNTVVNKFNVDEDMNHGIEEIAPFRWKVFQVLLLEGENTGANALRNAEDLLITREQFDEFLKKTPYLLLDEEMRFLNCQGGKKIPGRSILDVGVEVALEDAGWETERFVERGGIFDWGRQRPKNLEW